MRFQQKHCDIQFCANLFSYMISFFGWTAQLLLLLLLLLLTLVVFLSILLCISLSLSTELVRADCCPPRFGSALRFLPYKSRFYFSLPLSPSASLWKWCLVAVILSLLSPTECGPRPTDVKCHEITFKMILCYINKNGIDYCDMIWGIKVEYNKIHFETDDIILIMTEANK